MSVNKKVEIETLGTENLRSVLPGCSVQLQFGTPEPVRLPARLIGYDHKKYLIVKLVENDYWTRHAACLFEGNEVVVRMLLDGSRGECIAYKTRIRWKGYNPLDFLYLAYPETVQKCDFRVHPRVATCFAGNLNETVRDDLNDRGVNGVIKDVSLGGCCFEFDLPKRHIGISEKSFQLVAGDQKPVIAEVRNQRKISEARIAVGMQFRTSLTDIKKLLSSLYIAPEMLVAH